MLACVPQCAFEVERGPDWLLVRARRIDASIDAPQFAQRVWRLLQQHFTYRLVLELDGLQTLTNAFVEQLLMLQRQIEEQGGIMRLCGLSPRNCRVLRARGLDDRLHPYRDREEAVMGRPHPGETAT